MQHAPKIPMASHSPPTHDHVGKDFFAHPLAAADLLNTLELTAPQEWGIEGPFRSAHIRPMLGQELQGFEAADTRRVDLLFWIENPLTGRTVGVVHV